MDTAQPRRKAPAWFASTKPFETPSRPRAILQLVDTLGPHLGLGFLAFWLSSLMVPWYWLAPLPVLGGLFLVRLFILFHDCCHGSFWSGRRTNALWGGILGILTFTPYRSWRKSHGTHHAHNGNLDKRGIGDVWTMTLEEFRGSSRSRRFWYRAYRNPLFLFVISPPLLFLFGHRMPDKGSTLRDSLGVHATSLGCLLMLWGVGWFAGWQFLLWYALPTLYVATVSGVWLFYVQHQFDPGYWEHEDHWDSFSASMVGSSFYRLPKVAQWFSGNIGFHHIHHLRPRIPNYRLEACCRAIKELQLPHPLTVLDSLKGLSLHVWDEAQRRLLTFREARAALV